MPSAHDEIERDQYNKINDLANRVASLTAAVDVSNQVNIELLKLLKKVILGGFLIILILLGALIFGAIGKEGLFAVRQSIPIPEKLPTRTPTAAIPWHNDFDNGVPLRREDAAA